MPNLEYDYDIVMWLSVIQMRTLDMNRDIKLNFHTVMSPFSFFFFGVYNVFVQKSNL